MKTRFDSHILIMERRIVYKQVPFIWELLISDRQKYLPYVCLPLVSCLGEIHICEIHVLVVYYLFGRKKGTVNNSNKEYLSPTEPVPYCLIKPLKVIDS